MTDVTTPQLSPAEELMHTTVRLSCRRDDGTRITGTGFFFSYHINADTIIPVIVTNKHVIERSVQGTFALTAANEQLGPNVGNYTYITLDDFEQGWIKHPNDNVDLAVLPMAGPYNRAKQQGFTPFVRHISETHVANTVQLSSLSGIDDILMIGYPDGIWDSANNMPIVRRGLTATHPKLDYEGLPIFVIDCACFPGSSGSPVLIFNYGTYTDATGTVHVGTGGIILLGVLFAGPQHVARGEIKTIDIPLKRESITLSQIPNNLGFVVKAEKVLDFRTLIEARIRDASNEAV